MADISLGIYEKALPNSSSFNSLFTHAAHLGFSFIDISIDESAHRLDRLTLTYQQRRKIVDCAKEQHIIIGGICLSAHRKYALGSPIKEHEQKAIKILKETIDLAHDIGASTIQIAGYYTFYDPHDDESRERFINNLAQGVDYASQLGIILGIENVDGEDITNLYTLREILQTINSPWLQAYPDVGNCAFNGDPKCNELKAVKGHIAALHVKDVKPGEPRHVPFGEGITDFDSAFSILSDMNFRGRVMLEMWNESNPNADKVCMQAKRFISHKLRTHGFSIEPR